MLCLGWMGGCASSPMVVPDTLKNQVDPGLTFPQLLQNSESYHGKILMLGGEVLSAKRLAEGDDVGRLAHRQLLGVRIVAHRADDRRSGVQTDAAGDGDPHPRRERFIQDDERVEDASAARQPLRRRVFEAVG